MRICIHWPKLSIFFLLLGGSLSATCQQSDKSNFEFFNAPFLFKEDGKSFQQVVATCKAEEPGTIQIFHEGKSLLNDSLKKGDNQFLLTFPAVNRPENISLTAQISNSADLTFPFTLVPPKKWEVFLVQHSHMDIGYTRPQSEILAEHLRYIDYALDYCDKTDSFPDAAKFRWTCESAWVTQEYLNTRPAAQIERLMKRIKEGRIEVTAMLFNMAEIADENIMVDFLSPLKLFKEYDIPVYTAMQNDVNGIAWVMPD
jgi:hypothetical protein